MRKNLFVGALACAALTMTGCSNNEVIENAANNSADAIQFSTYVGRNALTRASVETLSTLQGVGKGFGVFAYYTGKDVHDDTDKPDFMYNQQVTWTSGESGKWTYAPLKYWPNNTKDKVSFFAYAPYSDNAEGNNIRFAAVSAMQTPEINFTVNNTVQSQTDLLYADQTEEGKTYDLEKQAVNKDIAFKFQHALARIGFTVKVVTDEVNAGSPANTLNANTKIYVKKVVLLKNGGDFDGTVDETAGESNTDKVFYTTGTLNLKESKDVTEASWNTTGSPLQVLSIERGASEGTAGDFTRVATTTVTNPTTNTHTTTWGVELNSTNSATPQTLNNDDAYMMIIPQDLSSNGFRVYVEYDVVTKVNWDGDATTADNIITNTVTTKDVKVNFKSGKAYTLNLQLGMTSAKISATAEPWFSSESNPVTETPVNNPANN